LTLILMAAGMGSRFGAAKQLTPVGPHGESILDYNARDGTVGGFDRLVIVTRKELLDEVVERAESGVAKRLPTEVVLQEVPRGRSKPLGTAEAVSRAAPYVDGPFCVANSDDLYGPRAFRALAQHLRDMEADECRDDAGAVVVYRLADTVPEGDGSVTRAVLSSRDGEHLDRIVEVRDVERADGGWTPRHVPGIGPITGAEPVSMNLWGLPAVTIDAVQEAVDAFIAEGADGEIYLPEVVGDLVTAGRLVVRMLPTPDLWCGLTNPEDLPRVREHVASRWPAPLWR
jgi:bifunctional N-acetylglucosamine-1-phosphate-uridyltransferase/glucosamine-1-phosphate-acetyltransferase GlmU-like protein